MVVEYQYGERRELGHTGSRRKGHHARTKIGDQLNLEDRASGTVPRGQVFQCGAARRRGEALAENLSGMP